jgi:amino acid adenylation domain-containing protein
LVHVVRELGALYEGFSTGRPCALPALPIQYADYAAWQRRALSGDVLDAQLAYWKEQLAGAPPALELPTDRPRPAVQTYRGAALPIALSPELSASLVALSRREGVTLFMTLLAALQSLLQRYTGQDDIVVGSPIAGRTQVETEGLIGFFVNTLVLRTDLSKKPSVKELLQRVRQVTLGAYAHQDVPFEKLVEELAPARDLSRSPFFQAMLVLQNAPLPALALGELELAMLDVEQTTAKFDLTLSLRETEDGLRGALEYNADLFDPDTIERFIGHYHRLLEGMVLEGMVAEPVRPVAELPLLTAAERHQVLVTWNDTAVPYPHDRCVHELFEEQVDRTPDAVALVFEEQRLTYRELDERSNQLAHHLRSLGVGPDVLVDVFMERSIEMVVALYGVLKAGGAYVPVDPDYPAERVAFMVHDSGAEVMLTQQHLIERLPEHPTHLVRLDADWPTIARHSKERFEGAATPEHLAYVIYTSGSTGKPKGAMNSHRGVCNRLLWMRDTYRLTESDRVLQKTPVSFDVSVWELFGTLLTGARLVIARPEGHKDSAYLADLVARAGITTMHFVPSMLRVFLEEPAVASCRLLRRVICSGEALSFDLQERFFERLSAELYNLYGPTEAAVDVTSWQCVPHDPRGIVPIGRPVANTRIHILDEGMRLVPVGVAGELHIGGVQVGRGYLNRPELTAERFVEDPFCDEPGARLYKTGDLARHLPDGSLEYLGRLDHQVKIRGYRIELGEIEATLVKRADVLEAVVVAREDVSTDKRLVAYVVADQGVALPSPAELRKELRETLPTYMIPTTFVELEALPLTPNGRSIGRRSARWKSSVQPRPSRGSKRRPKRA